MNNSAQVKFRLILSLAMTLMLAPVSSAWAAIALVTSGLGNGVAAPGGAQVTINSTGASLYVVCVASDAGNGTGQGVSSTRGNTLTKIGTRYTNSAAQQIETFYSVPSNPGSGDQLTYSGSFGTIMATAWSGTHATTPLDTGSGAPTGNNGTTSTSIQPGSVTPTQNGALIAACSSVSGGTTSSFTAGSGFTVELNAGLVGGQSYGGSFNYLIQSTAAAVNPLLGGWSSNPNSASISVFLPAGGAPTVPRGRAFFMGTP